MTRLGWAVGVLAAVLVGGCAGAQPGWGPGATPTGVPTTPAVPSEPGVASATVAVYYLGNERIWQEGNGQPVDRVKLYREFHRGPAGDGGPRDRTVKAVTEMLDGSSAYDPDYRTGWPSGARVLEVRIDGATVTVDIGGAERNNVGAEVADQAVQQLIWTVTAASGKTGVRLLLDGAEVSELWGHVAVGGVLRRAPALDVLAHVWLIDPQHDATVGRTFTVHVSGAVFESTIQLRVRQTDRTVLQRFVTVSAPAGGQFGEAKTDVTLPPGTYTIEAYAESAVDGRPQFLDNHTIRVQ